MTHPGTNSATTIPTSPDVRVARAKAILARASAGLAAAAIAAIVAVAVGAAGGSSTMALSNPWLPRALRISAVAIYAVVVVVHLWHLRMTSARERLWHTTHVLMAVGMIYMFEPTRRLIIASAIGKLVFAFAAVAILAYVAVVIMRGERLGWLWLVAAVDLAAMAYMFAMPTRWFSWLTWLLVVWSTLQAVGWLTGVLPRRADLGSAVGPVGIRTARPDISISVTLALMNIGMAYMFVAMALGMPHMPQMRGM